MNLEQQRAFYPTGADLRAMGQHLAYDVCLWTAKLSREYCNTYARIVPAAPRSEEKRKWRKPVASKYVGVSLYRDRWFLSHWTIESNVKSGHLRPHTDEGERCAAQDRAHGLGLEYLALRDGTREAYSWQEYEEMTDE